MRPRALGALDTAAYKYAVVVPFMGRVFGFTARRAASGGGYEIGYVVLSAQSSNPDDDTIWRDFEVLPFPHELRQVGRGLIVIDFKKAPIPARDAPFSVVADDRFIYVFRQSNGDTLYADRFVYDDTTGRLLNAWETRFRRSRKYDIPLDSRDTFGSTDMEGHRFLEPTTELTFVGNLQDGRFAVAILPTELPNVTRWQIFAYDAKTTKLNSFSILRSRSGWFDLRDSFDDETKTVPPEASFSLSLQGGGALTFASAVGCVTYNRQELLADEYGRSHLQKRAMRVMLAVATGPSKQIAVVDFGIGKDGKIAQVDSALSIPASPTIGTGLLFVPQTGSNVAIPALPGSPTGPLTFETWINARGTTADAADFIVQSAAGAAVPFAFALDAGIPTFTAGSAKKTVQASDPLDAGYWYHLAAVWDGTAATVYVNGQPFDDEADALEGTPPQAGYLLGGADGLQGTLDEVRLWNVARTQDEILATMCTALTPSTPGWSNLAGYWTCDEPADATRFTTVANSAASGAAGNGVLTGAQWVSTSVPTAPSMQPIAWDANGLSATGMLLTFAATGGAPALVDGGDSKLHLYYANSGDGKMLAAHLSVVSARASYSVPWLAADPKDPKNDQAGVIYFVARSPGAWMNQTSTATKLVTITPEGAKPKFVTVVLRSTLGLMETWPKVPNTVADFVAVINGDAIQTTDDPAAGDEGTVMYDYRKVVVAASGSQKGSQPAPGIGSSIFSASPDSDPDNGMPPIVQATGTDPLLPARHRAGLDNCWLYDPPLADIGMSAEGQYVSVLDADAVAAYEGPLVIPGDAAIEAWLKPAPFTAGEIATVLVFNKPPAGGSTDPALGTRYMLELDPGGRVICAKGNVVAITEHAIKPGEWTHVAGSFASDYGLQLGGARYLDAGTDVSLSSTTAVTVEAWIRLDKIGGTQAVASKFASALGTSWRLYVDNSGKLCFEVSGDTDTGQESRTVVSTAALDTGTWHHVAGVYTIDFVKETAIMFARGSYVKLPQVTNPPSDAVTVMMWVKVVGVTAPLAGMQILIQSTDPNQAVPFVLFLQNGVPTFTAYVGSAEKTVSAKSALRSNDWIHLAGRYSATLGVELYVDGQSTADLTAAGGVLAARVAGGGAPAEPEQAAAAFDAAYSVGGFASQKSFIGMINQLSLWNRGLTADEIRQRISRPPSASDRGLVGYWPFQDMFGTTVMDFAGTSNGEMVNANWVRIDKGAFAHKVFIDGRVQAFAHVSNPVVPSATTPVMIGSGYFTDYLQGAIGDIRLWKSGRMNWQIQFFAKRSLEANAEGLISNWTLATGGGRVAFDAKGDNNAVIRDGALELSDEAVVKMWLHTTFKAGWTIYVGGREATSAQGTLDKSGYGDAQATIASITYKKFLGHQYLGEINELRAWKTQRTAQQVRENMHVGLIGAEAGLVAYWPMSDGSGETVADVTGFGANGAWIGFDTPTWQGSTAPVGIELPQIRNVLGGIVTPYQLASAYAPAAAQYGAFQADAYGTLLATYLRAYVFVGPDQGLALFGAFKIGDLDVQYVGQAQMAPTLVGYIEGAPPLPAENLKVYPDSPGAYNAASSISANETGARTLSYTASRDTGFDTNINMRLGANFETKTDAGIGVSTLLFGFIATIGLQATFSLTLGWLAEALISNEIQSTVRKSIEVRGAWHKNEYQIDKGFGALFFPNNMGYALVRSGTADVFALRIKGTGALVSYQLRPNPDIPEDVNIIMFKLRATYVKNGTLDGWIGFEPDKDYKYLKPGTFGSYFKPVQAYALKQLIDRERQQYKTYFDNFDAGGVGRRTNAVNFQPGDIGDAKNDLANVLMGVRQRGAITSEEWKTKMARRSMVNTYVWTSDGGLYAEDEQFTAVREEQTGGNYSFMGQAGAYTEMKMSAGLSFELDALFGGHIVTQAMKGMNESAGFNLDVTVSGESYIGLIEEDPDGGEIYTEEPSPGKVRGYRFMSFYLAPSKQNFDEFRGIVDEDWLFRTGPYAGTFDPDALALRQALNKVNEVWRVLHRVTYVSRTPPQVQDSGQSLAKDVQRPDEESTTNNSWLIADLPPGAPPNPMAAVSQEADALLADLETNPVWGPIVKQNRTGIKQDIMTYMTSYYAVTS